MRKSVLLALLALVIVAGVAAVNEFAAPRIDAVPVPGDPPLTFRFAVSNRGYLTTIRNVDFTCVAEKVEGRNADGAPSSVPADPFPLNVDLDLGPRDAFQYTCPIKGMHLPEQVTSIRAHVEADYTRFGRRHMRSADFIWDSQSKVWMLAR